MTRVRVALAALVAAAMLAGCSAGSPVAPAAPDSAEVQPVPQMSDNYRTVMTFCLAPAGSGLRVFESKDGHNARIASVVDVHALPTTSPFRCP